MNRTCRFIFVAQADSENLECIFSRIKSLLPIEENDGRKMAPLFKLVLVSPDFKQVVLPVNFESSSWVDTGTFTQILEREQLDLKGKCTGGQSLEECLHETSDQLSCTGCSVHFYTFLDSSNLDSDDSFIPLAGALLRLRQWHHAQIYIVKTEAQLSALGDKLVSLVSGQVLSLDSVSSGLHASWSGTLTINDCLSKQSLEYSGFFFEFLHWDLLMKQAFFPQSDTQEIKHGKNATQMESTEAFLAKLFCGHTIEVLQEVDVRTLPLFLLSPWTFILDTYDAGSSSLVQYLHGKKCAGLVARLPVYRLIGEEVQCGNTSHRSTAAWKDHVMSSPSISPTTSSQIGLEEDDPTLSMFNYLHLLILPNLPSSTVGSNRKSLLVRVLVTSHQIARHVLGVVRNENPFGEWGLFKDDLEGQRDVGDKDDETENHFKSLPVFKVESFLQACFQLQKLSKVRNDELGDESDARRQAEKIFDEMTPSGQALDDVLQLCDRKDKLTRPQKSGLSSSEQLSRFPEWIALLAESNKHPRQLDQSSSDIPASSTSCPPNSKTNIPKEFSIDHILNLFMEGGPGKEKCFSQAIKLETKGHAQEKCTDMKSDESHSYFKHDIYQYTTEKDFDMEVKYAQVRDQGCFQDTQSSFVTPKKKNNRLFNPVFPTRSSPRSKFAGLKPGRGQSPKKLSDCKQTFKQPHLFHGSSSSHHRKRPASSLTPESDPVRPPSKLYKRTSTPVSSPVASSTPTSSQETYKRVPFTTVLEPAVRRSPRKLLPPSGLQRNFGETNKELKQLESSQSQPDSQGGKQTTQKAAVGDESRLKRSERHMMRLKRIIAGVLKDKGVVEGDAIHSACSKNLLNVSIILLKTLPNSKNLTNEMKSVVHGQVQQIINLEKRRSGIAI